MIEPEPVGLVGLGIMGHAYASHLIAAGHPVVGHDTDPAARDRLVALVGTAPGDAAAVAAEARVILLALPSEAALDAVAEAIAPHLTPGTVVCEMGTFAIPAKERAAARLAEAGAVTLDCPVSGTGAQAATGDLAIYASGDALAVERVRPILAALGRDVRHVGPFGAGMTLKLVANLLVTVHNLAAAEALLLAQRSGLDLSLVYDAIAAGAGTSRMFEVRGPLMIADRYEPATMKHEVYAKDLALIMEHARAVAAPTPLMAATLPFYAAALAAGRGKEDTASLFAVLKAMTEPQTRS